MESDPRIAFLAELVATRAGRQHLLSIAVDAEEGDESHVFDQLADCVDDPRLRRLVVRHRDDEVRHAALFRGCLDRLGFEHTKIPDSVKIIRQIAAVVGGSGRGVRTVDDIIATYAMLFAIEERGVEQFPLIADAFHPVDPETAEVYRRVARDERGHVRYCDTIGRHYAGDGRWEQTVALTRAVEAAAFEATQLANIDYCTERGWVEQGTTVA